MTDQEMTRTLKDYRPQHDEGCESERCRQCGARTGWISHDRMMGHAWEPLKCTCGLDTLLAQPLSGEGVTPPQAEQDAEITRLRDEAAVFAADAAAPTCQHCGLPLTCSSERAELIHGLQQMYAETLTRAEQAEAALAAREPER